MLTLLSVMAVMLGAPLQVQVSGARLTASNVAPTPPEWQPAPQPQAHVPLTPTPAPEPFRLPPTMVQAVFALPQWFLPARDLDLVVLGRAQTDGG